MEEQTIRNLNPSSPEFVPQPPFSLQPQPLQKIQGWIPRGHTTWQYNVITNQIVGGYFPRIRTKGIYLYDLDAVAFDPAIDVPIKVCFNCWQLGHPQQRCSLPKTHTYCNNCGRINVSVDKCPRCARAYKRFILERQARKETGMSCESYDDSDYEPEDFDEFFKVKSSLEMNEISHQKTTVSSVANQTEEQYFSNEESDDFDDFVIDEDKSSYVCTSDFLAEFTTLMDKVKILPIETQNDVVQQFLTERRAKLQEQEDFSSE